MSKNVSIISTEQGFKIKGGLVYSTAFEAGKSSQELIENYKKESLLIDCSDVARIDSAGIALMVEWKRWCKGINKPCHISGIQLQASALIETYKLSEVLLNS